MDVQATLAGTSPGKARHSRPFQSILYESGKDEGASAPKDAPDYFHDLNLDQIVESVTSGKDDYDLRPFFHAPLRTVHAILYRQEVMRDLQDDSNRACIGAFAAGMRVAREKLAVLAKLYCLLQKERWLLHAMEAYCTAVRALHDALSRLVIISSGLTAFRAYVTAYVSSDRFIALDEGVERLCRALSAVRYTIHAREGQFTVRRYDGEPDYSEEVTATFARFQQGGVRSYLVEFQDPVAMNHIEEKVLEFVAALHPDVFKELDEFVKANRSFEDPVLMRFDREVQFYVAYLEYIAPYQAAGLGFCYPVVSETDKAVHNSDAFDLALAGRLLAASEAVVRNDLSLERAERILVVSGPNQGGKTTFARTFGQLHHLASLGCLVPGRGARLFIFDALFTHFEREEDIRNLHGKLQDDLVRVHDIIRRATPRSIIIINEIFNSTALHDAVFLAREVMRRIIELDVICVCVTFLSELASLDEKTVSMVGTVLPDNPAVRTFKVVRQPADGRAYAISIAEKYGLTYDILMGRIATE